MILATVAVLKWCKNGFPQASTSHATKANRTTVCDLGYVLTARTCRAGCRDDGFGLLSILSCCCPLSWRLRTWDSHRLWRHDHHGFYFCNCDPGPWFLLLLWNDSVFCSAKSVWEEEEYILSGNLVRDGFRQRRGLAPGGVPWYGCPCFLAIWPWLAWGMYTSGRNCETLQAMQPDLCEEWLTPAPVGFTQNLCCVASNTGKTSLARCESFSCESSGLAWVMPYPNGDSVEECCVAILQQPQMLPPPSPAPWPPVNHSQYNWLFERCPTKISRVSLCPW